MGIAAACSNVVFTGFGTKLLSLPQTYSAKAPSLFAEHRVTRVEQRYVPAHGLDLPRHVDPGRVRPGHAIAL